MSDSFPVKSHGTSTGFFGRSLVIGLLGCIMLFTSACVTSSRMSAIPEGEALKADPSKAQIVFMRPSSFGGAIQSSVYHVTNGKQEFIGIVSTGTKIAFATEPGEHLFMVVGENADFMIANVQASKTYYALVSPRIGMWKARFSLLPIHNDPKAKYNLNGDEFKKWNSSTHFVESAASAKQWYDEHAADISAKRTEYMAKWDRMLPVDKANLILHENDGIEVSSAN